MRKISTLVLCKLANKDTLQYKKKGSTHILDHIQVSLDQQGVQIASKPLVESHFLFAVRFAPQLCVFNSVNGSWQLSIKCSRFLYVVLLALSPELLAPCTCHFFLTSLAFSNCNSYRMSLISSSLTSKLRTPGMASVTELGAMVAASIVQGGNLFNFCCYTFFVYVIDSGRAQSATLSAFAPSIIKHPKMPGYMCLFF